MTVADLWDRPLLTVEQAAELLGWGRSATYEAVRRGELPSLRRGRLLFVPGFRLLPLLGITLDQMPAAPGADVTNP